MLINPHTTRLPTIPGTRILEDSMGLSGLQLHDPINPLRVWMLHYLYAPISRRKVGGVRAKLIDNKGYMSFCNQRDLEVLLGIAKPGSRCHWTGTNYPEYGDCEWFGFCVDLEDLEDDLLERELRIREAFPPGILPSNIQLTRRVHDTNADYEELHMLLYDMDRLTGYGPDPRLETISQRWVRVERTPLPWELADT